MRSQRSVGAASEVTPKWLASAAVMGRSGGEPAVGGVGAVPPVVLEGVAGASLPGPLAVAEPGGAPVAVRLAGAVQ